MLIVGNEWISYKQNIIYIYNTETFYGCALKLNMCTIIDNVTGKLIRSHEKLLFNLNKIFQTNIVGRYTIIISNVVG